MNELPVVKWIELAMKDEDDTTERYSGAVQSLPELLKAENIAKLERVHKGPYAFVAFHPMLDKAVAEYVSAGSLASDAGPNILALYITSRIGTAEAPLPAEQHTIELVTNIHPAYEFVRMLLPYNERVSLPGIVFFDKIVEHQASVYVPVCTTESSAAVASACRRMFNIADKCFVGSNVDAERFNEFCVELKLAGFAYKRSGQQSFREWLVSALQLAWRNKKDISAAIGKAASIF